MNKNTLVWTLIVAVPVGIAALATAYIYQDTGKLPFQEGAETASAPAVETDASEPDATASAPEASEGTQTAEADTTSDAQQQDATGPSFDVVGVEPTGETVVAGRSDAGAIVALTANGKVVGKSIANEAGEWTIILDEPLKPGDYDVGLEVHDEAGEAVSQSQERLVVSLPEGGKEQPLVVLNSPDGPSDILQKPEPEQQVAAVQPAAGSQEQASAETPAPATETARSDATTSPQPTEGTQTAGAATQPAAPGTRAEPASETDTQVAAVSGEASDSAGQADTTTAPKTPSVAAADPENAAAAAPEAATETASGQSQSPEGTSATQVAKAPASTPGETETARSNSQEEPAPGTETAVAQSEQPAAPENPDEPAVEVADRSATPETQASTDTQVAAAPEADAQAAKAEPTVTVEAVESEKDKVFVAGTGEPGSSVRVYVGDEFQGQAEVNASGKWLVQGTKNIAEGNVEVRADLIGNDDDAVDARAAVTFEKEQDKQIVLTKVIATGASGEAGGQGAEVNKALPVVIIRKGDNLWRISRRLYGEGVRYTTIYQANQDQIRNPDLIYPGQVFLTPEGDLNWKPPVENNG